MFGALLWLAGQELPRTYAVAAACVALVAAAGLAAVRYDELRQVERIAQDLAPALRCVDDHRTLVQGNLAQVPIGSAGRIDVLTNEAGRITADTDGLDLLAVDLRAPQWVQRYRPETSAAEHLVLRDAYVVDVPPPLDFDMFERETAATADCTCSCSGERRCRATCWRRRRGDVSIGRFESATDPRRELLQAGGSSGAPAPARHRRTAPDGDGACLWTAST